MNQESVYEKLRMIIGRGLNEIRTGRAAILPRHKATFKLLSNMFDPQEAELLVKCFTQCGEALTLEELSQRAGLSASILQPLFDDMNDKGKIMKIGKSRYMLLPYVPAASERYFVHRKDAPEKMKKVAEAQAELYRLGLIDELSSGEDMMEEIKNKRTH